MTNLGLLPSILAFLFAVLGTSCGSDPAVQGAPPVANEAGTDVSDAPMTEASTDTLPDTVTDAGTDVAVQSDAVGDAPVDVVVDSPQDDVPQGPPARPAGLTVYEVGNPADSEVDPSGPALLLMGGGPDVDAAFAWWRQYLQGGDVVVLRTSGGDGYNDYLFDEIGGCDSVETLLVTTKALADDPYVAFTVAHAEGIFLSGGDQATYLEAWKGTALQDAVQTAWARGAVVGGTSAGCAVLGEFAFAAYHDTVYSDEALADPYNSYMTMERGFLSLHLAGGVVTDTHFVERDRMGRLVAFLARIEQDGWGDPVTGMGVDENTALVVAPDGMGTVVGSGHVYVVKSHGVPQQCVAGEPLTYGGLFYHRLAAGDSIHTGTLQTSAPAVPLSVDQGQLVPSNPY